VIGKAGKILWQNILKGRFRRSKPARRRVFCNRISLTRHSNRDVLLFLFAHCTSWANSCLQLTRCKCLTKIYRWILLANPHNSIIVGKVTWETGSFLCVNPAYSPPHTHRIPVCKTSDDIVAGDWYHNVYISLPLKPLGFECLTYSCGKDVRFINVIVTLCWPTVLFSTCRQLHQCMI
jgi:hypothetical protein